MKTGTCLSLWAVAAIQLTAIQPLSAAQDSENPVALYKGFGAWHHKIATNNPEAQKFFDQG